MTIGHTRGRASQWRRVAGAAALALIVGVAGGGGANEAAAAEPLQRLAGAGPWPAVSSLIGYGERLWFLNAVLFTNHNSADVYSYDPVTGNTRYEAHLFSQGRRPAGGPERPAVLALRGTRRAPPRAGPSSWSPMVRVGSG